MDAQTPSAKTPAKLVVFDWNGTLLDDAAHILDCINLALAAVDHPPIGRERFSDGHNWPLTMDDPQWPLRSFYRDMGLDEAQLERLKTSERSLFHDAYAARAGKLALRPGAEEILKHCRAASIAMLILSNHLTGEIRKQLRHFAIEPYFADILAYADRDTQFRDMPKGEKLRRFMAGAQREPGTAIIVGDTLEEIMIARELGMVSIALTGGVITEQRLRAAKPDHLIHSLHELKPILQERGFASC